jgi:hypothetical protein
MRDFRELKVWSKAHTLDVYKETRSFPEMSCMA